MYPTRTMLTVIAVTAGGFVLAGPPAGAASIDCGRTIPVGAGGRDTGNQCSDLEQQATGPNKGKLIVQGTESADVLRGTRSGRGDILRGKNGDDRLVGERGDDVLLGGNGDDTLDGSGDNDHLVGGRGNDTLFADAGGDRLEGGPGDDRYVLSKKSHRIDDSSGRDTLVLNHFNRDQSTQNRSGDDLVIKKTVGTRSTVTIVGHFAGGRMETIQFRGELEQQRSNGDGSQSASGSGGGSGNSDGSDIPPQFRGFAEFGGIREPYDTRDPEGFQKASRRVEDRVRQRDREGDGGGSDGPNGGQVRGADPGVGRNDLPDSF